MLQECVGEEMGVGFVGVMRMSDRKGEGDNDNDKC